MLSGNKTKGKKVRILFVHQNLVIGGAEELRLTLLRHIDRSRYAITICNIEGKGEIGEEIRRLGFPVIALNRKCRFGDFRITAAIYREIKRGRYDIVQTSLFYANFHGRLAAFLARTPVIISEEHNIYKWKSRHPIFILADKILAGVTHKIITCSESVKRFTSIQEKIAPDKFLPIHNCIDVDKFHVTEEKMQLRKVYGFDEDEKIVIIVGTLCEQKGHRYLFEAFTEVKKAHLLARLLVVGNGPGESELRDLVKKLKLDAAVTFTGARRDIPQLLALSDLFVLPSLWEGFGIALLEAMAAGLAVIATGVDGVPEVVLDGETGILSPPADSRDLARNIIELLGDEKRRETFGSAGRMRVRENFNPHLYLDKLTQLYNHYSATDGARGDG